jgi:hypothetical protein
MNLDKRTLLIGFAVGVILTTGALYILNPPKKNIWQKIGSLFA